MLIDWIVKEEWGTAVAQWVRYCTTNQKVAGSVPDGVMEFFIDINPSNRTVALGSTQPVTEMSAGIIS
jgi:membrane-bound lytic murein transglycosylase B